MSTCNECGKLKLDVVKLGASFTLDYCDTAVFPLKWSICADCLEQNHNLGEQARIVRDKVAAHPNAQEPTRKPPEPTTHENKRVVALRVLGKANAILIKREDGKVLLVREPELKVLL